MCSDGRALNDEALTRVAGRIHSALRGCLTANPHCAPAQAIRATTSSQSPPFQAPGQKTKSLSRPAAPCSAPAEPPPEAPTFPCAYISLGFPERRVDCYRPLPLGRVALPERASRAVPCMSHRSAGRGLIRPGKDSNLIEVVFFFCLMRPGARAGRCHGAIEREPRPRGVAKRLRSTARALPSPPGQPGRWPALRPLRASVKPVLSLPSLSLPLLLLSCFPDRLSHTYATATHLKNSLVSAAPAWPPPGSSSRSRWRCRRLLRSPSSPLKTSPTQTSYVTLPCKPC